MSPVLPASAKASSPSHSTTVPGWLPGRAHASSKLPKELGWHPNPSARGLTSRRAYALGLIVRRDPSIIEADPFFSAFIAGVETVLAERGQVLVLSVVPDVESELKAYTRLARDKRVDGFLITDLLDNDHRIQLIERLGMHAVTLGEPNIDTTFPVISRDYDRGIAALTEHLIALGHTRIAHVSGDEQMLHGRLRRDRSSARWRPPD